MQSMYKVCDPLHGYISFDEDEQKIIEHPYFQRLRFIQQLGFVQYAYPGAVSNRFLHSLGVCHLAGRAFDSVFSHSKAQLPLSDGKKKQFRKVLKLAALLHDIGHGPLSHTTEFLMPSLKSLNLKKFLKADRPARHEDYTLKFIMDSELSRIIQSLGLEPLWPARLLHPDLTGAEDFFREGGLDFLPLLRQIVSSDLDVDRMDYIHRDSYYCGVNYGRVDSNWLLTHFTFHQVEDKLYLALNREALWTAESFLLGRHHMHLTVYFHHKPVVYEKMLSRYRESEKEPWTLPCGVEPFSRFIDGSLFEKLKSAEGNEWAARILNKNPYHRVYEISYFSPDSDKMTDEEKQIKVFEKEFSSAGVPFISANSSDHSLQPILRQVQKDHVFVKGWHSDKGKTLFEEQAIFKLQRRQIHRIYADPNDRELAQKIIQRF